MPLKVLKLERRSIDLPPMNLCYQTIAMESIGRSPIMAIQREVSSGMKENLGSMQTEAPSSVPQWRRCIQCLTFIRLWVTIILAIDANSLLLTLCQSALRVITGLVNISRWQASRIPSSWHLQILSGTSENGV